MKLPIIAASLFSLSNALPTEPTVGDLEIVGGVPVTPFAYPWLVALQQGSSQFCGGSLLDATTIITAAHCSVSQRPASVTVYAHRHNLSLNATLENALVFSVTRITSHPQYKASNKAYDAAIWKVKLTSGDASTIPANKLTLDDGSASADENPLIISGWGTTSSGGRASKILLETKVNVFNQSACRNQYSTLDATSICAAAPGKDTCQGDSGGPMFSISGESITLVGLTSYGQGCADPKFAGVYTRVSTITSWIKTEQEKA
jgi:trypsin